MSRPIWKGQISFGLVNVPVNLHAAEAEAKDLRFRMLDRRDKARIRYERINEVTGEPVAWDDIVKGYEVDGGEYVIVDEEELKKLAPEATQTVNIESFADEGEIDPVWFEKPYYLVPGKRGEKGYVLLLEALKSSGKIGIARVVIRTKEHVAAVLPWDKVLVLMILRYHEELRDPAALELPAGGVEGHGITKKELEMADKLVASMAEPWDPERHQDEFQAKVVAWLEKKAAAGGTAVPPEPGVPEAAEGKARVIDFMELLKRSVEEKGAAAKGARKGAAPQRTRAKTSAARRRRA